MTNDERIAFLSEHPINSRWGRKMGGGLWWTVAAFFADGHGETFMEALDNAIESYREKLARHNEASAGLDERRGSRP